MGQGEDDGTHSDDDAAPAQPGGTVVLIPEVADEHDGEQAGEVVAAEDEARLAAPEVVVLLYGGEDAADVSRHQHGLGEHQGGDAQQVDGGLQAGLQAGGSALTTPAFLTAFQADH